ncbi:DUF255 domain-containing protein [Flammeovirga yaeyamensis]|uniref:DUF255 domain-containing protein n=1 Tax=Flammeovirga yaeyamensis TaxID=367791 RepID=A0AAX1N8T6_9BACT|nr:thioredoxin family protein [Flammeovirga yaeyamensis]MBB3698714.1 thioredoxin-related protein [Flammeovirga yaeyamensis]NMF37300.1 thioredoxin family protein [Flammeovirga yaeyamensis]QWG03882.1 DUF255 domain-containing protein [Flammeovirga yaeyamensis]
MKYILSLFIISFFSISAVYKENIEWKSIDIAIGQSENDNKPIFVDVYTDWCGWCKVLDKKTFQHEDVVDYVKNNYHAVKLNPEKEGSFTFKGKNYTYDSYMDKHKINSYPAIIVLHPNGKEKVYMGYRDSKSFLEILKKYKKQVD